MTELESDARRAASIRWWPLWVIAALAIAGIVAMRLWYSGDRQAANLRSLAIGALALLAALLWWLLLSRARARHRLAVGLGAVAAVALLFTGFRIRGVTGDLLPIFEWRWAEPPVSAAAAPPPTAAPRPSSTPLPGLADYPQFFGPDRDGELDGPALATDWDARPPEELWRCEVGEGWSGFAVAGRRAITQEQHGEQEAVVCYDVADGSVLWVHHDPVRFESTVGGVGPRATPTIRGDRVFTQGATGLLHCLDLATGEPIWTVDILADNGAPRPDWGVAGSPLLVGDVVVVNAGGDAGRSLVAYDAATGKRAWSGGSTRAHYSSPVRATLCGVDQVLIFNAREVSAHAVPGGDVLWTYGWKTGHPHVCMPVPLPENRVLVASGYGTGCHLVQITRDEQGRFAAERRWRSLSLKAKFTNLVARDGFAYGLDDGILACVDLATGRRRWKAGRYGHGQVILVGTLLLVTAESGEVALVDPVPDEHRERARFAAFDDKMWNPPALAGRYLLVRTDSRAACYRLPTRDT